MAKGTVNKVMLIGRLGQDPDIRYSQGGMAIAKFSLATNERVSTGGGEYKDETEWHRIVAFGKTAEFVGNYLTKGKVAYIEGRLRTSQWEDSDGNKRYTTEILANEVQGLSGASEGNGGNGNGGNKGQSQNRSQNQNRNKNQSSGGSSKRSAPADDDFGGLPPDDDIPF